MYNEFAKIYDALMKEVDYNQWADYLFRNILNAPKEVKTILEFGCGTGNITTRLAKKGYEMTGVDLSEEMLTVADEKAREEGLNIPFYLGDMADFTTHKKYDCVIAACDSVNYLPTLEDVERFIEGAWDALNDNGLLLFDINTISKFKHVIADQTFIYDLDEVYCVWESEPIFAKNKMNYNLTFFTPTEDGKYERNEEVQTQYIYMAEHITKILKQVGFKDIKCLSFGAFIAGNNESDRLQFVAVKREEA